MTQAEKYNINEELSGSYFYEERRVGSTRKSKTCDICGNNIPIKSGHLIFKMYGDDYYDFDICNNCEKNEKELLSEIRELNGD